MLESARRLFLGGLFGKVLGVAREIILASLYGTGSIASSFRMAQSAFLIPFHGFLSDAINGGFTPIFSKKFASGRVSAASLFAAWHTFLIAVSFPLVGLSIYLSESWIAFLAPGFSASDKKLAVEFFCVFVLSLPLYAIVSLYSAVDMLTSGGRMNAMRPTVQSAGLIVGAVLAFYSGLPVFLAAGFLVAYLILGIWGLSVVKSANIPLFVSSRKLVILRPALLAVWIRVRYLLPIPIFIQVYQIVERRIASQFPTGVVAALDYAKFFSDTAVILFAMPFAVAGLSFMAQMSSKEFVEQSKRSVSLLVLFGVLCSFFFFSNAEHLVRFVFERGSFDHNSTHITADLLRACSFGVLFQVVLYGAGRFLSGRGDNVSVMFANMLGVVCGVAFNFFMHSYFGVATLGYALVIWFFVSSMIVLTRLQAVFFFIGRVSVAAVVFAPAFFATITLDYLRLVEKSWLFLLVSSSFFALSAIIFPGYRRLVFEFLRGRNGR